MSSLHRFLTNADVLNDLFDTFSPDYNHPATFKSIQYHDPGLWLTTQTLAHAARTCKAFSGAASRNLWSALHSGLLPLVQTFSNMKRRVRVKTTWDGVTLKDTYYELEGDVPESEWIRFEELASRVRYLGHDLSPLDPSVLEAILMRYESRCAPLFSNIRILSWRNSNGDQLQQRLLRVLCTPAPMSLWYLPNKQQKVGDQAADLSIVAAVAPILQHLQVELADLPLGPRSPLLRLTSLRSIRFLGELDEELRADLGTLPNLGTIHCRGASSPLSSPVASRPPTPGPCDRPAKLPLMERFPALQKLEVAHDAEPTALLSTLAQVASPRLASLSIRLQIAHSMELISFVHALCELPAAQALTTLCITTRSTCPYPLLPPAAVGADTDIEFADLVRSLSRLPHIQTFRLVSSAWGVGVSDAHLALLADAWPRLSHFEVSARWTPRTPQSSIQAQMQAETESHDERKDDDKTTSRPSRPSRPSLPAVVHFAERCRALTTFAVEIADVKDSDVVSLDAHVSSPAFLPHRALKAVKLARGDERIRDRLPENVEHLARVLHRAFPCIDEREVLDWCSRPRS
ncbi:hypothetical protein C8Q80DRAFT_1274157 [Daedaleopsis nitida]|nr:hypothetical protein C8Q80DRAFT_1274157 [Daedaleopsis nitida]